MYLDAQQAKLFIKVDGVIGDRRRICTFCNNTIHGAEKVVETTRKLRRGPYFPQLAFLQSSVGKIDTMGRAIVCLACFHELLRQWNTYEQKNVLMSRRVYKHVADKGVKNYQETRASEIRTEAEKRAFAIQTKQEHIVKKAFERLTRRLDAQEEIIRQSEDCIEELNHKLALCTKGERWKINREIKKHQKIISAAEARIEDEEDKEELIRKETKSLLEVYKNHQSLFRAVSEPNLSQSHFEHKEEKSVVFEDLTDRVSEYTAESSQSDHKDSESGADMSRNQPLTEHEYSYKDNGRYTVVKTMRISQSEDETDSQTAHAPNDGNSGDVWASLEASKGYVENEGDYAQRDNSDWHMTKEVIYSARSDEVQSFPEDEWSKLFDKEENDSENQKYSENQNNSQNQHESSTTVRSSVTWTPQRSQPSDDTDWTLIEVVEREQGRQQQDEASSDSDSEKEQVYEFDEHLSNNEHGYGICDRRHAGEDMSLANRNWEDDGTAVIQARHEYQVSSDPDVEDPWDSIHIEKETGKHSQAQHMATQDRYSPNNHGTKNNENDNIDEYDRDNFDREENEILSPRRLNPTRFSEFTKSSYTPEPGKERIYSQRSRGGNVNSSEQYNGIQIEKIERQNDVRIVESSKFVPEQRTRNVQPVHVTYDPLEPLRKSKIRHEQHLSVEEEEWETKHLSPKRLDETKWLNFANEMSENADVKPTSPERRHVYIQEQNNRPVKSSGFRNVAIEERQSDKADRRKVNSTFSGNEYINNNSGNDRRSLKSPPNSKGIRETQVKRSPALRKLMKQDEISEQPIRSVTTKASVQSSPWDNFDSLESQNGVKNEQSNETFSGKDVGKIDLKRWSSEVESNRSFEIKPAAEPLNHRKEDKMRSQALFKQNSLRASQDAHKDEMVIINRNQSPKKAGDVYLLESKNESNSPERVISPSFKYKGKVNFYDHENSSNTQTVTSPTRKPRTVIIEDEHSTINQDGHSVNSKRVGKVNLSLWEQNGSSQHNINGPSSPVKVTSPTSENRVQSVSSRDKKSPVSVNDGNFESERRSQYSISSPKSTSATTAQERKQMNSSQEPNTNHRSLNKSMSEDELAWEKRFSKSYERKISVETPEEQLIQRKLSEQRIPRLKDSNIDKNDNYFTFGKISLDEEEVLRVRNGGNKSNYGIEAGYDNTNSQSFSQIPKYSGDVSQLTEEEQAWEEKTTRPGRLDFSKFSHFK